MATGDKERKAWEKARTLLVKASTAFDKAKTTLEIAKHNEAETLASWRRAAGVPMKETARKQRDKEWSKMVAESRKEGGK